MTRTLLSREDAGRVLAPFGLSARAITVIAQGTVNSNFRVETDGGTVFLRVNEGKRREDVDYEGALLWHLAGRRFPTPQPLRTSSGTPYVQVAGHLCTVFPWVEGHHVPEGDITAAHADRLGELLARMHVVAADFPGLRRGIYTFERIVERVARLSRRAAGVAEVAAVLPLLEDEIAWLGAARPVLTGLPLGTIHGDLFPDNLLWAGERLVAALDFEQASRGQLAYDLAVTLLANCWREGALVDGLAWSLLSGYQRVRELTLGEREGLWALCRTAALRFTVTRITDVFLPSLAAQSPAQPGKDFRDFLARLSWLRERGADALLPMVGERPPLRAV